MKTTFFIQPAVLALGAMLALSATVARADDEKPTVRHHRHRTTHTVAKTRTTERPAARGPGSFPSRDDRNSQEVTGGPVGGANGREYRVRTGTAIPKSYNRKGYTTDSDQNSFIIDKNDQRLRSHNNVGEALRQVPGVSVSGPRGL